MTSINEVVIIDANVCEDNVTSADENVHVNANIDKNIKIEGEIIKRSNRKRRRSLRLSQKRAALCDLSNQDSSRQRLSIENDGVEMAETDTTKNWVPGQKSKGSKIEAVEKPKLKLAGVMVKQTQKGGDASSSGKENERERGNRSKLQDNEGHQQKADEKTSKSKSKSRLSNKTKGMLKKLECSITDYKKQNDVDVGILESTILAKEDRRITRARKKEVLEQMKEKQQQINSNSKSKSRKGQPKQLNSVDQKLSKLKYCKHQHNLPVKAHDCCPTGYHCLPLPDGMYDIDLKHRDDPAYCRTYVKDINSYLSSLQHKHDFEYDWLNRAQNGKINKKMRAILVDWIVEVAEEFYLLSDTLYLCLNYVDRYLNKKHIHRSELQLLGISCLLLSAKYEEIFSPSVSEFCVVCDFAYEKDDILRMEQDVLKVLNYELTVSTAKNFLRRFQRVCFVRSSEKNLCNYLAELCMLDSDMRICPPTVIAAAALCFARFQLYEEPEGGTIYSAWTPALEQYSGYTVDQLAWVIHAMHTLQHSIPFRSCYRSAIWTKYSTSVYDQVSKREGTDAKHLPTIDHSKAIILGPMTLEGTVKIDDFYLV